MHVFDESLHDLQEKAAKKQQLDAKLEQLQGQRRNLDRKVVSLRVNLREEQADVEKLEGRSLTNYFLMVVGKLDQKLDQERKEAYTAKVKLDAAQEEMTSVETQIQEIHHQLRDLRQAESNYARMLEEKRTALKSMDTPESLAVLELEGRIAAMESQRKEIQEAISAGRYADSIAQRILDELESANNWNTWDLIGGSGLITHIAKHSHLDDAQDLIHTLQRQLSRFKTELADIKIDSDIQVNVEGFLRFADYFLDGLFADWAVGERIQSSLSSVSRTQRQIQSVLSSLSDMEKAMDREIVRLKSSLDEQIVSA